ncbi:MAG: hypothetical protein ACLSG5_10920 [Oscillospiraceae bacterium]
MTKQFSAAGVVFAIAIISAVAVVLGMYEEQQLSEAAGSSYASRGNDGEHLARRRC